MVGEGGGGGGSQMVVKGRCDNGGCMHGVLQRHLLLLKRELVVRWPDQLQRLSGNLRTPQTIPARGRRLQTSGGMHKALEHAALSSCCTATTATVRADQTHHHTRPHEELRGQGSGWQHKLYGRRRRAVAQLDESELLLPAH